MVSQSRAQFECRLITLPLLVYVAKCVLYGLKGNQLFMLSCVSYEETNHVEVDCHLCERSRQVI